MLDQDQKRMGEIATQLQRSAADPFTSVWVAASAGTGKTKVLTDRILNLLLAGAKPSKILALTFTKAAASEMANRVSKTLGEWAVFDDGKLSKALEALLGQPATQDQTIRARQLFAKVLETPGGMRVQTIHAFCQSLLGRFPIEAGVPPNFELLDELSSESLMRQSRERILVQGFMHPNSTTAKQLDVLSRHLAEDNFIKIIQGMLSERGRVQRLFRHFDGVDGWTNHLQSELDVGKTDSVDALDQWFAEEENFNRKALMELAQTAELIGGKTNEKLQKALSGWLASTPADRAKNIDPYLLIWLTTKNVATKKGFTKPVIETSLTIPEAIDKETTRCLFYLKRRNAIGLYEANAALMQLVDTMLEQYRLTKAANAKLDYDDLILKTRNLLEASETAAQWVLFKLDEGLSHILVDEAQDTNADQWEVILLLAKEFFAGFGQEEEQTRTIFVVGDRKQSIYSFQRADPNVFDQMRGLIKNMVTKAYANWNEVPLNISFRSTSAVLDLTDKTLESEEQRQGLMAPDEPEWRLHKAFRANEFGRVVLWPLVELTKDKLEQDELSPDSRDLRPVVENPALELSQQIAKRIKVWTQEGGDPSQSAVRPGDILILLQNRQPLANLLVNALQDLSVPVAGLDRMQLTNQLAVQDLMMLGDFALFPDDDLALACVLRSPLCNFSDQDLYDVSIDRNGASIWSSLRDRQNKSDAIDQALIFLTKVLAIAERSPAFEFYAAVLSEFKQMPKMIARLGNQISDPVQEFLNRAISFEAEGPSSLQGFLHWMRKTDLEIKRDAEAASNDDQGAVRIMTVHGAKGLQAPVVILPDTTRTKVQKTHIKPMWETGLSIGDVEGAGGNNQPDTCWWLPRANMANDTLNTLKEKLNASDLEERRRLLYVALTRPENNLHVMGYLGSTALKDESWYGQISQGFANLQAKSMVIDGQEVRFHETGSESGDKSSDDKPKEEGPTFKTPTEDELNFLFAPVGKEALPTRPLTPSRLDEEIAENSLNDELVTPPLVTTKQPDNRAHLRFQRGLITHALLQHLPQIEPDAREEAMHNFLQNQRPELAPHLQLEISEEVAAVLNHKEAGVLFGSSSQAEVPLVGQVGDRGISGRVDRLVVLEDRVLIIDFKTNRPPPVKPEDVPKSYVKQMDYYAELLKALYPDKQIQRFLLWTDGCHLMQI